MTHAELVARAYKWVKNSRRCKYVLAEPKSLNLSEHPDVIGWDCKGRSIVVECKISATDLQADSRKRWRGGSLGMGFRQYYLFPEGADWADNIKMSDTGILRIKGRTIEVLQEAEPRNNYAFTDELALVISNNDAECRRCIKEMENRNG